MNPNDLAAAMGPMQGMGGPINQIDPYQIQADMDRARKMQQMAQAMTQQQQPVDSGIEALAQVFGAWQAGKKNKQADELISDVVKRQFEYDNQQKQQQAMAAQQAAEQKRKQELADYESKKQIDNKYAQPKDARTNKQKEYEYLMSLPPEQRKQAMQMTRGGQTINVGGEQYSPMQKELAKGNATDFREWRKNAVAASEVKHQLGALSEIMELQKTGKLQEAQAKVGQYFGTQAASNMQAFQGIASNLVLESAQKMSGVLSDSDIELLKQTAPGFGNSPEANRIIGDVLGSAAERSIKRYQEAQQYLNQNGNLKGYMPSFGNQERPTEATQPTQQRSEEDIFKQYGL